MSAIYRRGAYWCAKCGALMLWGDGDIERPTVACRECAKAKGK